MSRLRSSGLAALGALAQLACSGPGLVPSQVELPPAPVHLEQMDRPVAEQYQALRDEVARLQQSPAADSEPISRAIGELGHWYHANGDYPAAERCYAQAEQLVPDGFPWSYYLAHAASERGAAEVSRAAFERVLQRRPNHVASWIWLGELELKHGNIDRAQECYQTVLELKQNRAAALLGLGRVALARRDFGLAVRHLEAALAEQPDATPIRYNLGVAYRGVGDSAGAQRFLEGISEDKIAQNPVVLEDPLMGRLEQFKLGAREHQQRGNAALHRGRYAEAIEEYRRAAEIAPGRIEYRSSLARALYRAGRTEESVAELRKVIEIQPESAVARNVLGAVLIDLGRLAEAEIELATSLKLDPGVAETHYQLGNLDRARGRCQPALEAYAKALELEPSQVQSRFWSAVCLVRLGRWSDADRALQQAAQSFPNTAVFTMLQSRLLATRGGAAPDDIQAARRLAEQAFARAPTLDNAEAVAMARAAAGEFEAAIAWQQTALVSAEIGGRSDLVEQVRGRLELYRAHQPCREPWLASEQPSTILVKPPV
ncbi:MAG TPA: tetratricopeptide repeat protein [Acidobacteriota bacterium]